MRPLSRAKTIEPPGKLLLSSIRHLRSTDSIVCSAGGSGSSDGQPRSRFGRKEVGLEFRPQWSTRPDRFDQLAREAQTPLSRRLLIDGLPNRCKGVLSEGGPC